MVRSHHHGDPATRHPGRGLAPARRASSRLPFHDVRGAEGGHPLHDREAVPRPGGEDPGGERPALEQGRRRGQAADSGEKLVEARPSAGPEHDRPERPAVRRALRSRAGPHRPAGRHARVDLPAGTTSPKRSFAGRTSTRKGQAAPAGDADRRPEGDAGDLHGPGRRYPFGDRPEVRHGDRRAHGAERPRFRSSSSRGSSSRCTSGRRSRSRP